MIRLNIKYTLLTCFLASLFAYSQADAQTVFWSDNFDAPSGGANNNNNGAGWVLNSEGNSSNRWFINSPSGWGCSTSGNALHISCDGFLCGFLGGPNEPIYNASSSLTRTAVSPAISTVGKTNITLQFVYMCAGFSGSDYGLLALSSDGGTNWNELPDVYVNTNNCATKTIVLPAQYENIANLKIRYKWIENNSSNGVDPPFTVDNITLSTPSSTCTPPTVSAGSAVSICSGATATIGGAPTATGGSESGAYVYTWTPSTGLSNASIANPVANPTATTTYTVSVHRGTASCAATSTVTVTVNTPQTLSVTPAGPLTLCPGQTTPLTATAGFTNYVWTIPGGGSASGASITASTTGAYSVIATGSNTCPSTTASVTINPGAGSTIAVTPGGPTTFCSGQNVVLNAAGGFSNYVWSNGTTGQSLTVTASGSYSVVAEGGSCGGSSTPISVTVNQPAALGITPSGSASICPNQPLTLSAQSGFTNYVWSNGASGANQTVTSAGSYGVSATDGNGCTVQSSFTNVTLSAPFTIGVTPSGTVDLCSGQSITLTAQAGFTNYVWSNNTNGATLNVTSAGGYSVSANNSAGCTGTSDAVFVNQTPSPIAGFTYLQVDNPIYSVTFTSNQVADSYLWTFGNGATSTLANPTHTFPFDGTYPVTLAITNACGTNSITTNVVVLKTGIESISTINNLSILPSLDNESFVISGYSKSQNELAVNLINMAGQIVQSQLSKVNGEFLMSFETSQLSKGIYLITISNGKETVARKWVR
jgi:PKD repeat protein